MYVIKIDGQEKYNTDCPITLNKQLNIISNKYVNDNITIEIVENNKYYREKNRKMLNDMIDSLIKKKIRK